MRRETRADQRSSLPVGRSPSWARVVLDTIKLSWERRRQHAGRRRLLLAVLCGFVVLGGGLLVRAASGSGDPVLDVLTPAQGLSSPEGDRDSANSVGRSSGESSRALPSRSPSLAKAAAGAEIADRTDISVSPAAATVLREGTVDGRVLMVLASLASADLLESVEMPSSGSGESTHMANVELGVVDVNRVLDWLDRQRRLSPDRLEVHREGSMAYLLLVYDTTEPPGLFPS